MMKTFNEATPAPPPEPKDAFLKTDGIIVAVLVCTALVLRIWLIPSFEIISIDGTGYASAARRLGNGDYSLLARYGFYPVLVAGILFFTPNIQLAGQLVSATMGALLIIPVYALGLTFFNRKVALSTALLVVAWPDIVNLSCEVLTQSTFTTLITTGILLTWRSITGNSPKTAFLAGLMLGLAYMTRTEGIILPFALLIPLATARMNSPNNLRLFTRVLIPFGSAFSLILCVNLLLVHEATGYWQLAVKTSGALRDGLMYYLNLADYSMPPELDHVSYWKIIRFYPGYIPYSLWKNLSETWQMMLPDLLWLLAILGFLAGGWNRSVSTARLYLAASLTPYLVIVVFYYVGPGYYQPYLPILLLWVGNGLHSSTKLISATAWGVRHQQLLARAPLAVLVAGILTFVNIVQLTHKDTVTPAISNEPLDGRLVQKELGLMADRFLPPGKIMTRWARTAFYADREWASIPSGGTLDDLLRTARQNQVRFLIVDAMAVNNCPQLAPLFEPAGALSLMERPLEPQVKYLAEFKVQPYPGMLLYMLYRDQKRVFAAIYEIQPEGQ